VVVVIIVVVNLDVYVVFVVVWDVMH
jgi:hypothetical protein